MEVWSKAHHNPNAIDEPIRGEDVEKLVNVLVAELQARIARKEDGNFPPLRTTASLPSPQTINARQDRAVDIMASASLMAEFIRKDLDIDQDGVVTRFEFDNYFQHHADAESFKVSASSELLLD